MNRFIIWFSALVIFAVVAAFAVELGGGGSGTPGTTALLLDAVKATDWVKGPADAKVTLVEYSDLQCPACGVYYPFVKKLNEEFGDRIQFVYRHFPLQHIHPYSELAAKAAEASGRQGKFWEMHDILFENQAKWSSSENAGILFADYAAELGLDVIKFTNDMDSSDVSQKIAADYQSGIRAEVNATPTFFVNGVKVLNPQGYEGLKQILDQALAESGS